MKAPKFLFLAVIALAAVVVSGCEKEEVLLLTESAINNPTSMNTEQDFSVPIDKIMPIRMIKDVSQEENIGETDNSQSKEFVPVSENNNLHSIKQGEEIAD